MSLWSELIVKYKILNEIWNNFRQKILMLSECNLEGAVKVIPKLSADEFNIQMEDDDLA